MTAIKENRNFFKLSNFLHIELEWNLNYILVYIMVDVSALYLVRNGLTIN